MIYIRIGLGISYVSTNSVMFPSIYAIDSWFFKNFCRNFGYENNRRRRLFEAIPITSVIYELKSTILIEVVFLEGTERGSRQFTFTDSFSSYHITMTLHNLKNYLAFLQVTWYVMETNENCTTCRYCYILPFGHYKKSHMVVIMTSSWYN